MWSSKPCTPCIRRTWQTRLNPLPSKKRLVAWQLLDSEIAGEVLTELNEEARDSVVEQLQSDELLEAIRGLDVDDIADLIQSLPGALIPQVLAGLDKQNRQRVESVLSWPEDSAGGLMDLDVVTVRDDVSLDVVLRYLRLRGEIPQTTDRLVVVDRYDYYQGVLPLRRLLTNDPDLLVSDVMKTDVEPISADMQDTDVVRMFEDLDLITAVVVDDDGRLLGRITIDDVVDVMREEADQQVYNMAGVSAEDDLFGSVVKSAQKRAVWLGINLLTALLAAWVIGQFEGALDAIVALAILNPVVASMGGIAGSQTLTLVIRSQAMGHLSTDNISWLLSKEMYVGAINGVMWSVVVACVAWAWFGDAQLGMVIGIALVLNLMAAAGAGVLIPVLLKRMGVDPALAGGVILTTVTDVVGFVSFLGLATAVLLN
ncbi:magnesium transporter MgtE-like [Oratosquilla oratoria]|uniref:magnesium transporter MgtE-like n=1 Tax=Oratosquilla oratoria TaxID=337810 RepID=UPI003F76664E